MFSISNNPQASMAEVLAKAKKYINGEEALIFKKGELFYPSREKCDRQATRTKPQKEKRPGKVPKERSRMIPKKAGQPQRSSRPTAIRKTTTLFTSAVHSPNSLSITGPARSTKRAVPKVANPNEVGSHYKGQHKVLRVPQGLWTPHGLLYTT